MSDSPSPQPLRVLALTIAGPEKRLTWHLRVGILRPLLGARGVLVDSREVPRERGAARAFFDQLPRYDMVWLHRHLLWPSELRRLRRAAPLLVLDIDDPVGYSSSAWGNFSLPRCLKFRATARASAAVLAASDGLVALARRWNDRVFFVPLCADPDRYAMRTRPGEASQPLRLLWLGGKSTFKYLEQRKPHLEAIGKRCPNVTLTVVGHSRLELRHLPVENLPWSPAHEQGQLATCHAGLAPLADDRWTRAKAALKPLQYLASGMPFVGSPVGVNNRLADEGRNGVLVESPEAWAVAVARLAGDESLRLRMAANGIRYVRRFHSPEVLAEQVGEVFRKLAA